MLFTLCILTSCKESVAVSNSCKVKVKAAFTCGCKDKNSEDSWKPYQVSKMAVVGFTLGSMYDLSSYCFLVCMFTVPVMSGPTVWALNPIRRQLLVTHKTLAPLLHYRDTLLG